VLEREKARTVTGAASILLLAVGILRDLVGDKGRICVPTGVADVVEYDICPELSVAGISEAEYLPM